MKNTSIEGRRRNSRRSLMTGVTSSRTHCSRMYGEMCMIMPITHINCTKQGVHGNALTAYPTTIRKRKSNSTRAWRVRPPRPITKNRTLQLAQCITLQLLVTEKCLRASQRQASSIQLPRQRRCCAAVRPDRTSHHSLQT